MALYIVGAGGFGRETLDAALDAALTFAAFADDRLAGSTVAGHPVLDPDGIPRATGASAVVAVADPRQRRALVERLSSGGVVWDTIVHPTCGTGGRVTVGEGSIILGQSYVSCDVVLDAHVHVNYGVTIGHDTRIGRCSTVLPGATVGGNVTVGELVVIGSGAVVLQGLTIGSGAVVGAGAVVTRDVSPGDVVVGVPARPRGTTSDG